MKCDTCKFNLRIDAFLSPPCSVVDWEQSSAEEYNFNECLFYQEDKFEVFIQNLERNLDTNKEV